MGFLVAGPGEFLASGHPCSPREATPNPVGLVRSTSGGLSWQTAAPRKLRIEDHAVAALVVDATPYAVAGSYATLLDTTRDDS